MKNLAKLLGIIALVAVIGFLMVACDNGGGGSKSPTPTPTPSASVNGTWVNDDLAEVEIIINNGSFESKVGGISYTKGTFATSGSNFTMTVTQINGEALNALYEAEGIDITLESKWYTKAEMMSFLTSEGMDADEANEWLGDTFTTARGTYTVTDSKLTLTIDGETDKFTKKS